MNIALIAISKRGVANGQKLLEHYPQARLFASSGMEKYAEKVEAEFFDCSLKEKTSYLFGRYEALVFFCSTGIAVRMVSSCLKDKLSDPAVLVVDDAGRFVVSLLSGHAGGANRLAVEIADKLGATAVITTASDSLGKISVDMLGGEFGWRLVSRDNLTKVSAAIVNDEQVAFFADSGLKLPDISGHDNLVMVSSMSEVTEARYKAAVLITDRAVPEDVVKKSVLYRPVRLFLGLGCNRGTLKEEFEEVVSNMLSENGFSLEGVAGIGTVDIKADEAGLIRYGEENNIPFFFFGVDEIKKACVSISPVVEKHIGVGGVCEPCAILAAGNGMLLVPKIKSGNVTAALAMRW